MYNKHLKIALIILSVVLLAELAFVGIMHREENDEPLLNVPTDSTASSSQAPTETEPADTASTTLPSQETEPSEPTETEPTEQRYVLTFTGDCTLGSAPNNFNAAASFIQTIGEDYGFPFRNVLEFFENDDFTMINLESVLADSGTGANKTFVFRGPTAYTQILTGSSVEAVTLANNHTEDFGKAGYESTKTALEEAGVSYVEKNGTMLCTTESGLTIGVYAACFDISENDMRSDIAALRQQGAEIVIAALHWGNEGQYRPTGTQEKYGHAAIDAGADIVYGHHPHVLQKIEEYNGGIIFYSLGNFSFGGNHFPRDMDSALVQQEVIRDPEGNISLGELTLIPISISSMKGQNNFQPTPYEEGTEEYERTMSKLNGTFTGPDLVVDYSFLEDPTESTQAPATEPPATQPGGDGGNTGGDGGDGGNTGGGDSGGGDSGGGDSGGDSGTGEG